MDEKVKEENESVKFSKYNGKNDNLNTVITDFIHFYEPLMKGKNVRDDLKRAAFNNLEGRILSIIRIAGSGDDYDKKWLASNIKEINTIFGKFDEVRGKIHIPRPPDVREQMHEAKEGIKEAEKTYFKSDEIRKRGGNAEAKTVATIAGITAATATGFSAFSFFGGPIVGGAVTGGTALVGAISTGVAAKIAYDKGCENSTKDAESAIRQQFGHGS